MAESILMIVLLGLKSKVSNENENDDLAIALQIQKKLIEEKYGTCNVKDNFSQFQSFQNNVR